MEILTHPIVREPSGLAMSSRNGYLRTAQKLQAATLRQVLLSLVVKINAGNNNYSQLENEAIQVLKQQGFMVDYITVRNLELRIADAKNQQLVVLAAVYLGKVRLLDNIEI